MKTSLFITSALMLAQLTAPTMLWAIGVSVSPATLSLRASAGKETVARFAVSNPSREVGLFEAYPEEFEESITLIPSRFVLEAGEKRDVLVRTRRREVGALRTAIAVEAQSLGAPAAGIGGGVRIPLSFEVTAGGRFLSAVFASGAGRALAWALAGVLTILLILRTVSLSTLKRLARSSTLTK